jgi:hypothetical protein
MELRSLYTLGSFTTVPRELARYKLDLVDVKDVTVRAEYTFPLEKEIINWEQNFLYTTE